MPVTLVKKSSGNQNVITHNFIPIDIFSLIFTGSLVDADFTEFKKLFNDMVQNKNQFGVLFDMTNVLDVQPNLLMSQVAYMRECENISKGRLIASAIVISNDLVKNVLSGLLLLKSSTTPNIIVSDLADGEEFVDDHISLHRINLRKSGIFR